MRSRLAASAEWRTVVSASLESMGVAGWELDLTTGRTWWSDNLGPLLGRPRGYQPAGFQEALLMFEAAPQRPQTLEQAAAFYRSHPQGESERNAMLPNGRTRWTRHRYSVTFGEDGEPTHVFALVTDIEDAHRRAEEDRLLGEVSRALVASLDIERTLAAVAGVLVPDLADHCVVELTEDGRSVRRVVADPGPDDRRRSDGDHPDPFASWASASVLRTGQPELHQRVTDDMLVESSEGDEERLAALRAQGIESVIVSPLIVRGAPVGALTLIHAGSGRRFDARAAELVQEVAGRTATAVDNARLHHELETLASQLDRLQSATSRLSRAIGEEEVAELSVTAGMEAMEADRGFLVLMDDGEPVELAADRAAEVADLGAWAGPHSPGHEPLCSGRPVLIGSIRELVKRFPTTGAAAVGGAWAFLPVAADRVEAVLVLGYDQERRFTAGQRAALTALAEQVGVGLHRARLVSHHRNTAHILQRGLMPSTLPAVAGLDHAAVYEPSGVAEAGGDWYDLFVCDGGGVAAMVGDTVGHGIPAVATMARIRHVLAGHLHDGMSPARALAVTNRTMIDLVEPGQRFATAAVVTVDPGRRRLTLALAGHPSPVLASRGGVRLLDRPRGMALGVDRDAAWPELTIDLASSTLLLLYTDGWIDHPGTDYHAQVESILELVERAGEEPGAVLDALSARFADRPDRDDAAALAIRID